MTASIPTTIPSDSAALPAAGETSTASINSLFGAFAAEAPPGSFDRLLDAPAAGVASVTINPPLGAFTVAPGSLPAASETVPTGTEQLSGAPATEPEALPAILTEQSASTANQVILGHGNRFARIRVASSGIDEAGAVSEATVLEPKDAPGSEKRLENQRDLIEAAAALLATLWPALQPVLSTPTDPSSSGEESLPSSGAGNSPLAGASRSSPVPSGPVVVIKLADRPAFRLSLPSLKAGTDAPLGQILAQTRELIAEKLAELPENIEARVAGAISAGKTGERFPSTEIAQPETPAIELDLELSATPAEATGSGVANFAAAPRSEKPEATEKIYSVEKNFLSPKAEKVKTDKTGAGIDVAEPATDMSETFTAHRYKSDQPVFGRPDAVREVATTQPLPAAATAPVAPTPTSAVREGSLAHQAVETILNVVDAQRSREAEAGVVNLHFRFAGEDLAVRVQLRGGEVHTQFRTDSAELRAALASEWRAVVGQGSETGVRLIEPVFAGSGVSSQQGFGSAPQGQFSSQQHAQQQQQQQAQGPALLPELRALRRGAGRPPAAAIEIAPRSAVASPTSQHLTAFA